MTPEQYQEARRKLGLTHTALAAKLGYKKLTSIRYGTGKSPIPRSVEVHLRMLVGASAGGRAKRRAA